MNTAMQWPILLIIILAFVKSEEPGSTSSAHLRVVTCPLIVGQPSCIRLFLLNHQKEDKKDKKDKKDEKDKKDKKDLLVWKIADGKTIVDVPSKEDFIFEGINKKEDLDFHVPVGYSYIWNNDSRILAIFIEEVGRQHEGAWVAEYFDKFPFHLKVLAAPPSTQAPDTSTDGVKDSGAVDAHREDYKDWKNMVLRPTTVEIILGLVNLGLVILLVILGLVIVFRARSTKQKRAAAFREKMDKRDTSQDDSSGQEETTDGRNASGAPSADISLEMLGVRAGQQSSGEGCNSSSNATSRAKDDTDLCKVEITTDDASSDHRAGDPSTEAASSSMPLLGETGAQGATPRIMQSFNSRGDSRHRLRNHETQTSKSQSIFNSSGRMN